MIDVLVVGAGPAGIAAALHLHRAGRGVLVVDKATFPRDKTCGDGLTTLALRELEALGLDPASVASWVDVRRTFLHSPSRHIVTLPMPDPPGTFAAVARRADLDAALVDLARTEGVAIAEGVALRDVALHPDRVVAELDGHETVGARWAIGADGMWSPLRRAVGAHDPTYRGEWHAFRQYFRGTAPGSRDLHVWFEADLLPGYAWSFPLPHGGANVGFGILRGAHLDGKAMAALWRDLLDRPPIRRVLGAGAEPEGPHRAWPIPAGVDAACLHHERTLFVGDAARAADVMTGEGIGQALLTGRLAAEAVLDATPTVAPATVADAYATAVRHHLGPDHRMASLLTTILSNRHRADLAIRTVGLSDWTRRNFNRWLFEDSPRGIALTPRRWRRGALSGEAAFLDRLPTEV